MRTKDFFLAITEAILWYIFLYFALYSLKNPVDLRTSALELLVVGYLAAWACPLLRHSDSWKRTFSNKQ